MIRLSASTGLNLYNQCQRCFWMHHKNNNPRPRGIFPSLPSGMDGAIKMYYDKYRGKLPPELEGQVDGVLLPDQYQMNLWRNWKSGMEYHDPNRSATLFGALDECLLNGDIYIPLDYKTKGSKPSAADSERYYQTQLDVYSLLLQSNGRKVGDHAYLVYYTPNSVSDRGNVVFDTTVIKIATYPNRAKALFEKCVDLLVKECPPPTFSCEYCSYIGRNKEN